MKRKGRRKPVPTVVLVLTTLPTLRGARLMAGEVLEAGVAACATVVPGLESHYVWKGRRERTREWAVLFKTTPKARPALFQWIRARHPYEVPEILSWKASAAWPAYARWVTAAVTSPSAPKKT